MSHGGGTVVSVSQRREIDAIALTRSLAPARAACLALVDAIDSGRDLETTARAAMRLVSILWECAARVAEP